MHRVRSDPIVLEALMQLPLTGSCQCGKIRYEVIEAPNWLPRATAPIVSGSRAAPSRWESLCLKPVFV